MSIKNSPNAAAVNAGSPSASYAIKALLIAVTLVLSASVAQARVRWVGDSSGCDATSIQTAINQSSSGDEIRITNDHPFGEWHGQALTINNKNITIGGHWEYCGQPDVQYVDGYQVLSGFGGAAAPVITIRGTSNVSLYGLNISLGDPSTTSTAQSLGGGIDFRGRGSLSLRTVVLQYNVAVSGGAIYMSCSSDNGDLCTGPVSPPPTTLTLRDNVYVYDNQAFLGGALFLGYGTKLTMKNAYTFFHRNHAVSYPNGASGRGGAIYFTDGATADIGSPHPAGTRGVFYQNTASGYGGAIYVDTKNGAAPSAPINLYSRSAVEPLSFIENQAPFGAVVAMKSSGSIQSGRTAICATHAYFHGNRSGSTSTSSAIFFINGERSEFSINSDDCLFQLPPDAITCGPMDQGHCDEFSENEAPRLFTSQSGGYVFIKRARVNQNNLGREVVYVDSDALIGIVEIYDSVIDRNSTGYGILNVASGGVLIADYITITGNSHGLEPVLRVQDGFIIVYDSIIDQEELAPLFNGSLDDADLSYILTRNVLGYVETDDEVFLGSPSFIPGFYRLQPYSAGIDRAMVSDGATDPDGTPRSIDNTSVNHRPGYFADLGAFESTATSIPPRPDGVFTSSFESVAGNPN